MVVSGDVRVAYETAKQYKTMQRHIPGEDLWDSEHAIARPSRRLSKCNDNNPITIVVEPQRG